jgi:hypothetical protein
MNQDFALCTFLEEQVRHERLATSVAIHRGRLRWYGFATFL